ncbi:MAG TPA: hypothetical protein VH814_04710 [Steroidobacteraceae bacterium]|jgi:hypothetical protein
MSSSAWLAWIIGLTLAAGSAVLAVKSNLLRDVSTAARRPFSFARSQLLWWVAILVFCLLHNYAQALDLPAINETCLVLLGVGVGTTGIANVIDARQRATAAMHGVAVVQDRQSQGFIIDILSDDNGVSVHRLQALAFNIIYGVAFLTHFLSTGTFEQYGALQYAVLGLSDVAYLGLKSLENDPRVLASAGRGPASGDELLDADPDVSTPAAVG